jgi:probable addiction module antidote protein
LPRRGAKETAEKLTIYDPAEDLTSDLAIAVFMTEVFATEDAGYVARALGVVASTNRMAQIDS